MKKNIFQNVTIALSCHIRKVRHTFSEKTHIKNINEAIVPGEENKSFYFFSK